MSKQPKKPRNILEEEELESMTEREALEHEVAEEVEQEGATPPAGTEPDEGELPSDKSDTDEWEEADDNDLSRPMSTAEAYSRVLKLKQQGKLPSLKQVLEYGQEKKGPKLAPLSKDWLEAHKKIGERLRKSGKLKELRRLHAQKEKS